MALSERRWTGTGTELRYDCASCGYEVKLLPPGAVGSGILMWVAASTLVTALFMYDKWFGPGVFGWIVIALFWLGGAWVYLPALWKLRAHPVTGAAPSKLPDEQADPDPLRAGIKAIERKSLFGAPLLLIAAAAAILLAAAAIGYVNDVMLN
ncbi:hypothetical protein [Mesorhizobium sp. Z1-4]|uniref:hypothetical protein n=1 Tax=Mesorhizobium sp. Z1-4 TaxID=2448478 RepID=UPI000FDA8E59|nr:hypothetical protein [Mesorhizobium sp. Z1-4]